MPQGTYTFPGIVSPKSGIYSQSHGTYPDRIELTFVAQLTAISAGGTVTFSYNGSDIVLPNCKVDQGGFEFSDDGFTEKAILWDRRWAWRQASKVSVHWNERLPDGNTIRPVTDKTPQSMLTDLFAHIGEVPNVSLVPNAGRPEVPRRCAHAADIIDDLCDLLGCRVVLGYNLSPVSVVPVNSGNAAPNDSSLSKLSVGFNPPEVPRYIQVRFAETVYQTRFETEPVGIETAANDNEIVDINSLSYTPTETWPAYANVDTFEDLATDEEIALARESVWRWFRIVDGTYTGTSAIPGYEHPATASNDVSDRFQVLPLKPKLDVYVSGESFFRLPVRAWGEVYFEEEVDGEIAGPPPGTNTSLDNPLPIRFSVDPVNGIIRSSVPLRKISAGANEDPGIIVELTHHVRNSGTWEVDSYEKTTEVDAGGFGVHTICVPAFRVVRGTYDASHDLTGFTDNTAELDAIAAQVAADYAASLAAYESYVAVYNVLRPDIVPTGKIRQVTHIVSDSTGAMTVAGQHMEWDVGARTYREKRRVAKTDEVIDKVSSGRAESTVSEKYKYE